MSRNPASVLSQLHPFQPVKRRSKAPIFTQVKMVVKSAVKIRKSLTLFAFSLVKLPVKAGEGSSSPHPQLSITGVQR